MFIIHIVIYFVLMWVWWKHLLSEIIIVLYEDFEYFIFFLSKIIHIYQHLAQILGHEVSNNHKML